MNNWALSANIFGKESSKNVLPDPIYKKVIVIGKGHVINAKFFKPLILSEVSRADDVDAVLTGDFVYKGVIIAPEGSLIKGKITKKTKVDDKILCIIRFTNILTPSGKNIPISAIVNTNDKSGVLFSNDNDVPVPLENIEIVNMQAITYVP